MLSFTVWLANDYMRGVAELASNSLAIKLTQAGCEVATRKSKVLRDSVSGHSCSCGWPLGVQASRAERNLGTIPRQESELPRRCDECGWKKSKGPVKRIRKIFSAGRQSRRGKENSENWSGKGESDCSNKAKPLRWFQMLLTQCGFWLVP